MAGSLNKAILIGNVGKDPEIRSTQDGKEIASFSVATSESWKDRDTGERKEKTEWHRVVIFSQPLVGIIKKYVHKGSKLYIEGSLHTRKWTDQSGIEKYSTEVVLQAYNGVMVMLDAKQNGAGVSHDLNRDTAHVDDSAKPSYEVEHIDDEVPF